jgi:hypothetical protein
MRGMALRTAAILGDTMSKKARLAILKNTLIAFALTLFYFCSDTAFAGGQECMASYYLTKSPACVDDILTQIRQKPPSSRRPDNLVGFFAQLFRTSPQERERILKAEPSDYIKTIDLLAFTSLVLQVMRKNLPLRTISLRY